MLGVRQGCLLSSILFTIAACGGGGETGTGGGKTTTTGSGGTATTSSTGSGGATFEPVITWTPCALDSKKASGNDAECADVALPADWADPTGKTINVFIKRWPVLASPAPHHVWLIQGGPGSSSAEYDAKLKGISQSFPEAQFYLQDPRGTGRSTRLGCAAEEDPASDGNYDVTLAEWPSCLATVTASHGDLLPFFTVTQTARDLGALIQAASGAAAKRTVLGQSYGTTLLQRWLHFFPSLATEVILDSLANPGVTFTQFAERTDAVGHDYLALCASDTTCVSKLGPDPVKAVEDAYSNAFDKNGCPALLAAGLDRASLARHLYALLTLTPYRSMIPPVIHRLARCNAADVDALTEFHSQFIGGTTPDIIDALFSVVLHHHIILSELWDASPPTPAAHLATLQGIEFGLIDVDLDTLLPTWPKYGGDPLSTVYPKVDLPILMVNGTLDAQTPLVIALPAKSHYTGAHQHFITVPGSAHGAIGGEPWSKPGPPCSIQIVDAFVNEPTAPIDESCFADAAPVDFVPDATTTKAFFGTTDPWGDTMGPVPPPPPPPVVAAKRAKIREDLGRARRMHRRAFGL